MKTVDRVAFIISISLKTKSLKTKPLQTYTSNAKTQGIDLQTFCKTRSKHDLKDKV